MNKYNFYFPGDFYVAEFYGKTEKEARTAARNWLGKSRLPRGTHVEPANSETERVIRENNDRMSAEYRAGGHIMDF